MYIYLKLFRDTICSFYLAVVGPFIEIKTGYRGFEMNEIRYFACILVCSKIIRMAYTKQNL